MKKSNLILAMSILGMSAFLTGCQGDERIAEVSAKEREGQILIENENASKMEADLQTRQNFYQGVAGSYEGMAISDSGSTYKIRIQLIPSLPAFTPDRIRMREEVASDLNNLYFNAQVLLWSPESAIGAVGCLATEIRPDLNKGEIIIASPDCPNVYKIRIHGLPLISGKVQGASVENTAAISSALMKGKMNSVQSVYGIIQPKTTSDVIRFDAERYLEK
jgi:hypothetical protein